MDLLLIKNEVADKIFSVTIALNHEQFLSDFGLEATSNLVIAFNDALVKNLEKNLHSKHLDGTSSSEVNGRIKFISDNDEFQQIIIKLANALNKTSPHIIAQITDDDLLLEDEQRDFFDKIISYELLHIILEMETDRARDGDKKPSKI
jgi:hypothetical protein